MSKEKGQAAVGCCLVLVVLVALILLVMFEVVNPGSGGCSSVNAPDCTTAKYYRLNGLVVDGDEPVFGIIGAVIVIASLGLLKSTRKTTLTLSERYCQYGALPASTAERHWLS